MMTPGDETTLPAVNDARWQFRHLGVTGVIAIIAAVLPMLGGFVLLGVLVKYGSWMRDHSANLAIPFVFAAALACGLAILPTYAVSITGGFVFGSAVGIPTTMVAYTIGATIGFLLCRLADHGAAIAMVDRKPEWAAARKALVGGSFWKTTFVVILLRLSPSSPFAVTNLVMCAGGVPLRAFIVGTFLGILPRTAFVVYIGSRMPKLSFDLNEGMWITLVGIALMGVALAVLTWMGKRTLAGLTKNQQSAEHDEPDDVEKVPVRGGETHG